MVMSTPQLTPRDRAALDEFCRRTRAALGANLLELRLFGSKARGDAVTDSDLDVLLVVEQDRAAAEDRVLDVAFDVNLAHDVYISPRVVSHAVMVDPVWRLTALLRAIERESVLL
jgi:predicted nucleotidyltransferase